MDQILKNFWSRVKKTDTCWVWIGGRAKQEYGEFYIGNKKSVRAHRFSYELHKEKIPEGMQIDHLCKKTFCVNPNHLEVVTAKENNRRSGAPSAKFKIRTHCQKGHEFTKENTYIRSGGHGRLCRICDKIRTRLRRL